MTTDESESLSELDRFCDAMIGIRNEIAKVEKGEWDKIKNPLKQAPHTARTIASDQWDFNYSREVAVFPMKGVRENKYWPPVSRIDNVYGDRNVICACPPMSDY